MEEEVEGGGKRLGAGIYQRRKGAGGRGDGWGRGGGAGESSSGRRI